MTAPDPRVGTVLHGRYRVMERINAGSMGVIYRAQRLALGKTVAIKVLHESYAATADGMRRFEVEARAMSRLSHPNCVSVLDYGVDGGAPFLVMEYIPGRNLRDILNEEGRLAPRRAVALTRQVVSGLAHAHGHRILHRDVKPENVLVTPTEGKGEQARIVDFGLAKLRDEKSLTTGVALGTPGYMSPEQTVGESADERSDVYGVGIVLYELLVGHKPFQSGSMWELMRMQRETPPVPPSQAAADAEISPRLEATVLRALAKARDARFPTMDDLLRALTSTREGVGFGQPSRRVAIAIAAGLAVVLLIAIGHSLRSDSAPFGPVSSLFADDDGDASDRAAPSAGDDADQDGSAAEFTVDAVDAMRELAAQGELDAAIDGLKALRTEQPRRAELYYALGNLYAEDRRWRNAVSAYARALKLDPGYAEDQRAIADVVRALANDRARRAATSLIANKFGTAALDALETAAQSSNRKLRTRAQRLYKRLDR